MIKAQFDGLPITRKNNARLVNQKSASLREEKFLAKDTEKYKRDVDLDKGSAMSLLPEQNLVGKNIDDPVATHMNVSCDECGVFPIVGQRFKSKVKENCDLCGICFSKCTKKNEFIRVDPRKSATHMNVSCDGCGAFAIVGQRFNSKVKENYDLCGICFSKCTNKDEFSRVDTHRSAPSDDSTATHVNVSCDGCGALPIVGQRFNSKVKENYDLCGTCFSKRANKDEFAQVNPDKSALCDDPTATHINVSCDGCGMHPIVGQRFNSNIKENYDLCGTCFSACANKDQFTRIDPYTSASFYNPFAIHVNASCDGCGVYPIVGQRFNSEVKENYDLCGMCFSKCANKAQYTRVDPPVEGLAGQSIGGLVGMPPPLYCNACLGHIMGLRFKSILRKNYNLCCVCYSVRSNKDEFMRTTWP